MKHLLKIIFTQIKIVILKMNIYYNSFLKLNTKNVINQ